MLQPAVTASPVSPAAHHRLPMTEALSSTLYMPVVRLRPRRAWLPRMVDPDRGCGWFESSRALRDGLEVIEWPDEPPCGRPPLPPAIACAGLVDADADAPAGAVAVAIASSAAAAGTAGAERLAVAAQRGPAW